MTWEVKEAMLGSERLDILLTEGYEPFAAFVWEANTYIELRKQELEPLGDMSELFDLAWDPECASNFE